MNILDYIDNLNEKDLIPYNEYSELHDIASEMQSELIDCKSEIIDKNKTISAIKDTLKDILEDMK